MIKEQASDPVQLGRRLASLDPMMTGGPEPFVNPASEASWASYEAAFVKRPEHRESSFTRLVEQQTAKIPSDAFLVASLAAMAVSLGCEIAGRRRASRFVGMWVAPILVMGVYNKLVKVLGSR